MGRKRRVEAFCWYLNNKNVFGTWDRIMTIQKIADITIGQVDQ